MTFEQAAQKYREAKTGAEQVAALQDCINANLTDRRVESIGNCQQALEVMLRLQGDDLFLTLVELIGGKA